MTTGPRKPTREEIAAAYGKSIRAVIAPDLRVLFCGINPGLYSGATGYHFARPGNRFWPALYAGGFTERLLAPHEERELLHAGYGITNFVARATATADELTSAELRAGGRRLRAAVRRYRPRFLAVLGIGAYRTAFNQPKAQLGLQPETIAQTALWILPNPSGLNAHYRAAALAQLFRQLRAAIDELPAPTSFSG